MEWGLRGAQGCGDRDQGEGQVRSGKGESLMQQRM